MTITIADMIFTMKDIWIPISAWYYLRWRFMRCNPFVALLGTLVLLVSTLLLIIYGLSTINNSMTKTMTRKIVTKKRVLIPRGRWSHLWKTSSRSMSLLVTNFSFLFPIEWFGARLVVFSLTFFSKSLENSPSSRVFLLLS